MRRILVTGGAGFIGSNFIHYLLEHRSDVETLVNLDRLTYAGNLENLVNAESDSRYHFVKGDVRDQELAERLFQAYEFDTVVHFAAESQDRKSVV